MSTEFNLKFDKISQGNSAKDGSALYQSEGNVRNICFVQINQDKIFLGYSYMTAGEYMAEAQTIILKFTTHIITLKGLKLELLYNELMGHLPRFITCADSRYNSIAENDQWVVNTIEVVENKN